MTFTYVYMLHILHEIETHTKRKITQISRHINNEKLNNNQRYYKKKHTQLTLLPLKRERASNNVITIWELHKKKPQKQ